MIQKKNYRHRLTTGYWEMILSSEKPVQKASPVTAECIDSFSTVTDISRFVAEGAAAAYSLSIDCFASDLARFLMEQIAEKPVKVTEGSLPDSFYQASLDLADKEGFTKRTDGDRDILCINMKQMINIMREAELLENRDGKTHAVKADISDNALYFRLLNSFWNFVPWENIFPSDEEAARTLYQERFMLRDMLLRQNDFVAVDDFTNDFFEMTGFADRNDLVLISFIDFYLYSWLKHFNMLRYKKSKGRAPVAFILTEEGRRLLASCDN